MKREITFFNLPQLRYTTIKYMFIVLFVLLFYIVHCCIDIEDRSLSGLYFNKMISCYLSVIFKQNIIHFSLYKNEILQRFVEFILCDDVIIKPLCFSSLPDRFVRSLTFPTPYIFWKLHDSSTFCQNIMGCLKSCSEMRCPGISRSLALKIAM